MALENRVSQYPNRKRLGVVKIDKDTTGNITSLVVDVERQEGYVSNAGTALTAEALNVEIEGAVRRVTQNSNIGETQCECDYSNKVATTAFVWDVLTALGLTKISHDHNSTGSGGSGS